MPLPRNAHLLYHTGAFFSHRLKAWNTGGEGIHSPYLFYLVRMLMYDDHRYYIWDDIERCRLRMLQSDETVEVEDFGTGSRRPSVRRIADVARTSLEKPVNAQLLFRWVHFLSGGRPDGLNIVELGTSLGITTAYLAAPSSGNRVLTFEGSRSLADCARRNWKSLGITNITCVEGNLDATLEDSLYNICARANNGSGGGIDFAFIDANHTREATLRYWRALSIYRHRKSVFVVDDIHRSPGMEAAWKEIAAQDCVSSTMDLFHMGVVFFDPDYLRRHYVLRYP